MADEVQTNGATTPAEAPAKSIAQTAQEPDRSTKLLERYAAKAQIQANRELAKHDVEGNRDRLEEGDREHEASTADMPDRGPKQRDKDGKFLKADKPAEAKPEKVESEKPAAEPEAGTIAFAQKLVVDGKIADAMKAIGLDPEGLSGKAWEAFRKDNAKAAAKLERSREDATRARGEAEQAYRYVEQTAANLERQYGAYKAAHEALQAGDLDKFAQALGTSFDELNRRALQQLSTRDPEVAKIRAELTEERRARAEESARAQQATQWTGAVQRTQQALSSMEDPRVTAALSEDPAFAPAVLTHLLETAKRTGDDSMTLDMAVNAVLGSAQAQYARMQKIFGGAQAPPAVGGGTSASREEPSRRVSPAKPRPQLTSRGAAEAHAAPKLRGQALLDKYVRQAQAAKEAELDRVADE